MALKSQPDRIKVHNTGMAILYTATADTESVVLRLSIQWLISKYHLHK
jgi:hypothetical protein